MTTTEIYLDANATSPVLPAAIEAVQAALTHGFGNPSSSHGTGLRARALLDDARSRARRVLGAASGRLLFTSGATEGIQTAVLSALCALRERRAAGLPCGDLLLYGATEHKAVPESLAHWNALLGTGFTLQALPVDSNGRHDLAQLRALAPRVGFLCTMAANNESGVISDLDGIAAVLEDSASTALWMVDCVQALGKLTIQLDQTRIDYAPFSGHKLHAPKGIGMLYVRAGAPFTPLLCGGGQEAGQRSGTENMPGIAALGAVLRALEEGTTFRTHAQQLQARARLVAALRAGFAGIEFNTPFAYALPTTINFSVPGLSSKDLLDLFDAAEIRVSAGSACSAAQVAPSYVLLAMGLPVARCANAVRLSFGPLADDALIDAACARIAHCAQALRSAPLAPHGSAAHGAGVYELIGDGGWLVFDSGSHDAVLIDARAASAARIGALLQTHDLHLRAVLNTNVALAADSAALRAQFACGDWPQAAPSLRLADGSVVPALALGGDFLARQSAACYLLGSAEQGVLTAPRLVFGGARASATALQCAPDGIVPLLAAPGAAAVGQLDGGAFVAYLDAHPDALLIDVREACEHAAGTPLLRGRAALSLPLSRLAEHAPWLRGEARPLLLFCRSGNRSAKAAQLLRGLGHAQVSHLAGGLALLRAR